LNRRECFGEENGDTDGVLEAPSVSVVPFTMSSSHLLHRESFGAALYIEKEMGGVQDVYSSSDWLAVEVSGTAT
jgi:hypothetical protein